MKKIIVYEHGGGIAVGLFLRENERSCRALDPQEGERKVPAQRVWLVEDAESAPEELAAKARRLSQERVTADTLWQFANGEPLSFEDFAAVHAAGDDPLPLQVAALMTLIENPAYFRRAGAAGATSKRKRRAIIRAAAEEGRGDDRRFIPAAGDDIRAALQSQKKREARREAESEILAQLQKGEIPAAIKKNADELLFSEEGKKNPAVRALRRHCGGDDPDLAAFFLEAGILKSPYDYHRRNFLYHWPPCAGGGGQEFNDGADLPLAQCAAFSIDDEGTIEIDDAFSWQTDGGNWIIGIHIALPALGVAPHSPAERAARRRMISVYFPEEKHPMLPPPLVSAFSLAAGGARPALSLYTVFDPAKEEIIKTSCAAERVPISANYSPEDFSSRADADAKAAFANLERFAAHLARREKNTEQMQKSGLAPSSGGGGGQPRREFKIKADAKSGEVVIVARRERPEEKVVARLMVYLNQTWGEMLAAAGIDALFRVRGRILASPPADEIQYAWCSSPLRRYADLFNQRRLLALTQGDKPPPKEAQLDQIARRFEKKHDKAKRFQADMERFWALRLAARNPQARHRAEKTAANRARLTDMPIGGEVAKLPRRLRPGAQFSARVAAVDLIKLRARLEWAQ